LSEFRFTQAGVFVQGEVNLRRKHSFSKQHLLAAQYFATTAQSIENAHPGEKEFARHRAYVTGAILSAAAFLEASINELFHEAENRDHDKVPSFDDAAVARLAKIWGDIEFKSILLKYQTVLEAAGGKRFEQDRAPYDDAESLIHLRNTLMHYKPEWDDEQGRHHDLKERLEKKFPPNPLVAKGSLWFPHLCLGAGCAQWATHAVASFSAEFCARLKIPSRH